jgi:hypothetical protein
VPSHPRSSAKSNAEKLCATHASDNSDIAEQLPGGNLDRLGHTEDAGNDPRVVVHGGALLRLLQALTGWRASEILMLDYNPLEAIPGQDRPAGRVERSIGGEAPFPDDDVQWRDLVLQQRPELVDEAELMHDLQRRGVSCGL